MAKLTDSQMKRRLERNLTKDLALKRKLEKQKEKELYSQEWYQEEMNRRNKLMEELVPPEEDKDYVKRPQKGAPTLYDSIDINTFFNPVKLFKNEKGKTIKADFNKYVAGERLYEPELIKIDNEIISQDELVEFYRTIFKGEATADDVYKKHIEMGKQMSTVYKGKTEEESIALDDNGIAVEDIPTIHNKDVWKRLGEFRQDFFAKVSKYFQRFVPLYDKYVCNCCGKPKPLTDYYIYYNYATISHTDPYGNVRMAICKDCADKLFNYIYLNEANKSAELTMRRFCAYVNMYFEPRVFVQALRNFSVNEHEKHIIQEYLDLLYLDSNNVGLTFMDSEFLGDKLNESDLPQNKTPKDEEIIDEVAKKTESLEWTKEDIRNMKQVKRMVGYDPFEYETEQNRVMLYKDLLGMLEVGMERDMVKLQAAIQIVTSFLKIRQMNEEYYIMQRNNAPLSDLKALSELKAKELNAITKFSSDNGFAERFATAKAKGENTFTGILNKMNEDKFEDALVNKYDISTSVTIQQASDASFASIFKQLSMSETDAWKTVQDQLAELIKIRKENEMLTEEIRKVKYELKKIELKKEAMESGVNFDEDSDDYEDEDE